MSPVFKPLLLPLTSRTTKLRLDAIPLQPCCWSYAARAHLLTDNLPPEVHPAVVRRIVLAQSLYAAGAALCFINTYLAIAAIMLIQLNYAIAPSFCWGIFSRSHREKEKR